MRKSIVVANWKMHGSTDHIKSYVSDLHTKYDSDVITDVDLVFCPPTAYLQSLNLELASNEVSGANHCVLDNCKIGGQDLSHYVSDGAYTGEVSGRMLSDLGCQYVIIGHSERRQYFGENDNLVAEKFIAAIKSGLTPIFCVGENKAERERGETLSVVKRQLQEVLDLACGDDLLNSVIAYEPIWAIGTGLTATPEQASQVHRYIRDLLPNKGISIPVIYGGSVKPENAKELFSEVDIDGALVGGASLNAGSFLSIAASIKE
ncbi:triose-phosphate isomerase [Marinibactrum halimedae]|uniref:Triosephosphate isomerase n=1 Tax=Marinibactrum halimedae TaxID=1444977 RepID=A0AA37T6U9_9GAMM|nr:triose-phosphate isomerase [Marinibactrum halimedae]MCD9459004.1 triose-phosphate isomerase [Marinibactrum halimedae]GLS26866.1 triosephosphate isomerase [Marinibactrum halimedae]